MLKNDVGYIRCLRIIGLPGDMMNLGPGVGLIAPAGVIGAFNSPGTVFFADLFNGDNANTGLYPADAFETIAYALTQCTDDQEDVIVVLTAWNEATPIVVDVTRVHILGIGGGPTRWPQTMTATLDSNIFEIGVACNQVEIAGFEFGGGATSAAIDQPTNTCMGAWIHDCIFGTAFCGDTPLRGIMVNRTTAMRIERCKFVGTGGNAGGTLTESGVLIGPNATQLQGEVVNCLFQGLPTAGILVTGGQAVTLENNIFACDADTAGAAINLSGTATGYFVVGNKAMFGDTAGGMIQNPYLDACAALANHWAGNMKGAAFVDPA